MVHQNRPFFRKLLQYPSNSISLNTYSRNSYKNSMGRKLTPHKSMRVVRRDLAKSLHTLSLNTFYKLSSIAFDQIGAGSVSIWQDKTGAVWRTRWVGGSNLNQLYKTYAVHGHTIFSKFFVKIFTLRPLPLVTIMCNHRVFASSSFKTSWLGNDSVLEVKGAKTVFLYNTSSALAKESAKYWKASAVTSRVRGIAKNPVDHPNGGRANTKGSFKTPWGQYAKAGK